MWPLTCLGLTDGVTHWSLTGSRDGDKDAFLSFSDGVSQAGTARPPLLPALGAGFWVLALKEPQLPLPLQWPPLR